MNKDNIKEHYDFLSPYYQSLWGQHIHHGYWESGKETKEEAQENLIKLLIEKSKIKSGSKILDVGCGIGGSSIYLAKNLNASLIGITLSPVQVEIAKKLSSKEGVNVNFEVMDAENINLKEIFDVIWSIEALSHLNNQQAFFKNIAKQLSSGGKFAIIDWFKKDDLTVEQEIKFIEPIKTGMLTPNIRTMNEYREFMEEAGMKIKEFKDISENVTKTWDIGLDIIKNPNLWKIALASGSDFLRFLKAFKAMRDGFSSKTFVYGLIIAEKIH